MNNLLFNKKGITLIELLVALVILGLVVAGIYRVFIAQTKAYTIQDQVVEVQQNVRSAMEILLRDLRMAGYDDDNASSPIVITNPIFYPVQSNSITVSFEYYDPTAVGTLRYQLRTITYSVDVNNALHRQQTITPFGGAAAATDEIVLDNVNALNFRYGIDTDNDGMVENWADAAGVGTQKVIAIRVLLTANPDPTNPDAQKVVTPRNLESIVALRNLCLTR